MVQTSKEESRQIDGTSGEPVNYSCYACSEFVSWLAPDGRCRECTEYIPEEI